MAPASLLVVATLLTADPDLHGGAAVGFGVGAPFKTASAGFQMSAKLFGEVGFASRFFAGLVVPFGFGFFTQNVGFGVTTNYTTIDIMPGLRAGANVIDWVRAALELGWGPSLLNAKVNLGSLGSSEQSRTDFGMRFALLVELTPPALPGVFFFVEPLQLQARFGNGPWSEYRFSLGAGYRR